MADPIHRPSKHRVLHNAKPHIYYVVLGAMYVANLLCKCKYEVNYVKKMDVRRHILIASYLLLELGAAPA